MIKLSSMYALQNWLKIICVCSIFIGCATFSSDNEASMRESNRHSTRAHETRTVVWGNHSEAVTHSIDWLNKHKFLVVDRWVEESGGELKPTSNDMANRQNHMLSVAQKVGASLVVFVQVNEKSNGKKISSLSGDNRLSKKIEVEIRGVNVETTDIALRAKAWNSTSVASSKKLVMDLTTSALEKALKNPLPSLPLQQNVHENEKLREQLPANSATRHEEISQMGQVSQPIEDHPPVTSQISDGSVYTGMEEKSVAEHTNPTAFTEEPPQEAELQTSYSDNPNEGTSSSDSSVGLQLGSGALSVLYTPIKVVYAVLGGFFGGFAYILTGGNEETATSIWDSSLGGTYFLQPEHLSGDESILFMGESSNIGNAA